MQGNGLVFINNEDNHLEEEFSNMDNTVVPLEQDVIS